MSPFISAPVWIFPNLHALITPHHIQHLVADAARIDLIAFFQQLDRRDLLSDLFLRKNLQLVPMSCRAA